MRYRRNIRSMRCVTRNPPAMLIVASRIAAAPRITAGRAWPAAELQHAADHDDAADRVGDAHQRRVQRRRDVPDDLPADDAGEREDGQVRQEGRRRDQAERQQRRGASAASAIGERKTLLRRLSAGAGWHRRRRRGLGRRRRRLAARRRPHDLAVVHDQRVAHDRVFEVDVEVRGAAHVVEQVDQVVAVEEAGGRRQPARQIDVADDVDAVALDDRVRATVSAQLPPFSAARSTITEPFFIDRTMSSVIRTGAGRLGISAVVMMMSTSRACAANSAISAAMNAGLISLRVAAAALALFLERRPRGTRRPCS